MKYTEIAILFVLSTILFIPSLIHLTSTENAGGFRYRWYDRFDYVFNGKLYSERDAYTAPVVFIYGAAIYKIFPWEYLPAIFISMFYLISIITVYFLYKAFEQQKNSHIWAPIIFFYFQPQDYSLLFSIFFFVLALNFKKDYVKQSLMFSLSTLSKQIMIVPAILFLFFYNEKISLKQNHIKKLAKKLSVFLIPWIIIFLLFGFQPTINQLFIRIAQQGFTLADWITEYSPNEFILRNSKIYLYPTSALLLILSIALIRNKSKETGLVFLSLLFFLISQSKFGADPYFAATTPLFAVLFFKNKKLRPYLIAVIILFYLSYLQIYTGQLLMNGIARINLDTFNQVVVENMTHISVIPSPLFYPKNVFDTLQNFEFLEDKTKITNILVGDVDNKDELYQIADNRTNNREGYAITFLLFGWNCDQCKPAVTILYDDIEDYENSKQFLIDYYIENLPKLCEHSRTAFVLKKNLLLVQRILDYQGTCLNESDLYTTTINLKKYLYTRIPIFSGLVFVIFVIFQIKNSKFFQ